MEAKTQTINGSGAPGTSAPSRHVSTDEAALWSALATAADAGAFCRAWLDLQCATTPGAVAGLILLESQSHTFAPAAIWPQGPRDITHLRAVAEQALASGEAVVDPGQAANGQTRIAYPVTAGEHVCGVIVLDMHAPSPATLQLTLRQLHWGVGWILSMVWRHRADEEGARIEVAAGAMDLLAVAQEHERVDASAMALCNALAVRLGAERVSLGLVREHRVKLIAMSHAAWFRKRSDIVETVEAAMEEALDQHATVAFPAAEATQITLQQARLAAAAGRASVASLPMLDRGRTVGVLTVERAAEAAPLAPADILFCEAALALVGPAIALKVREERWIGGRIRAKALDTGRALFGPRRPVAKAIGIAAMLLLVLLALPIAQFRVAADAALEGSVQRAAAAPFAGFIASSNARAGDMVQAGAVLATLDDRDLKLDRVRWMGEVGALDRRYREALALHKRAEMNLFGAQLAQAQAQLDLTDYKLARTRITAPIAGVVVSGDVSQLVGTPIEEGKLLFEVAPLDAFRVVLKVAESDVRYVQPGQRGQFAPTGLAGGTVPFVVSKLTSVTSSDEGRNVFRVEAALDRSRATALRPGMEGVAKIGVDRRSRLWIWTRGVRDWLSLFFWKWLP
jgi:multidrug resistance efflux pump